MDVYTGLLQTWGSIYGGAELSVTGEGCDATEEFGVARFAEYEAFWVPENGVGGYYDGASGRGGREVMVLILIERYWLAGR